MNGTPIYDIKPYLPYADCITDAVGGFAPDGGKVLKLNYQESLLSSMTTQDKKALLEILQRDPRPQYHDDPQRIYGMSYGKFEVKFRVDKDELYLISVEKV